MKVVLISGHDALSDRKTGFHFWKDILAERGADVRFITVGVSRLSFLKKSGKQLFGPFNDWVSLSYQVKKFTWVPLFHPLYVGKGITARITAPLFRHYPSLLPQKIINEVKDADFFIIENGAGPLLVPVFAKHCPNARFIYNASDRLGVLKFHPIVIDGNKKALPHFSLIRCNAAALASDFPPSAPTIYVPQAIDKALFDKTQRSPYKTPRNAISVGDMLFDTAVMETLAQAYPDWTFHLFGKGAKLSRKFSNVREYGEMPFTQLLPYLQHADIGLAPYANAPDADYLSQSSLKMVQYTYCRLPIVAPQFAATGRAHVMAYDPDNSKTAVKAFEAAIAYDRGSIDKNAVQSWDDVIDKILSAASAMKEAA